MATVVVLSKDATMAFINGLYDGASINGAGELVLHKVNGSTTTLGPVTDHSELLHLDADDHPQYALADGSRGDFATEAQGALADDARPNFNAGGSFLASGSGQWVERWTVVADGIDADTSWEDRLAFFWDATIGGGTPIKVFWLNERFEPRYIPAKTNTTGLRGFTKRNTGDTAHSATVPVQQIMDNQDDRNNVWGILANGLTIIGAGEIQMSYVLVLAVGASIPSGTPTNTLIVRI